MNINWRNWYLMSAMELEGKLDGDAALQMSQGCATPSSRRTC